MKHIRMFVFVILIALFSPWTAMADVWVQAYGGSGNESASAVQQTTDGGYIVAGSTDSSGAGSNDFWILKLDISGNIEWQKTYGGAGDDVAASIEQTEDGGYVVAGYTLSFGAGKKDVWVVKLDTSGNIEWQKTYGGKEDDVAVSAQQTEDGGYIVASTTASFGAGKMDIWLLKLDKDGGTEWQKTYGLLGNEEASSVRRTLDQGYIVTGWTDSSASLKVESWILKLDSVGNVQPNWQLTYGGSGDDKIYSVEPTPDGKYIVVGSTNSYGIGKKDAWVMKLNGNGSIAWQRTWGDTGEDEIFSVQQTLDGGVVAAGRSDSFGAGKGDMWLLKFDINGEVPGCQYVGTSSAVTRSTQISGVGTDGTVKDTVATVKISDGSSTSTEVVPTVNCLVQGPNICVEPMSVDFGSVVIGTLSSQTVTVTNVGSKDLVIGDVDIPKEGSYTDFGIRNDGCSGQTLKSLASCDIEIGLIPYQVQEAAVLNIPSNDPYFSNVRVQMEGEGVPPISPSEPPNNASFSVCSLYDLPTFSWRVEGFFKSYEILFSKYESIISGGTIDWGKVAVRVKSTSTAIVIQQKIWKRVISIRGELGGSVSWWVLGVYPSGKTGFLTDKTPRSIAIEPPQSVKNPEISPTGIGSLPTLTWENRCNVNFKVWFGADAQFSKKQIISFKLKNPLDGDGKFSQTLTSQQWSSIQKLVEGQSGATLYWKVESWDGAGRYSQTSMKDFVLEE